MVWQDFHPDLPDSGAHSFSNHSLAFLCSVLLCLVEGGGWGAQKECGKLWCFVSEKSQNMETVSLKGGEDRGGRCPQLGTMQSWWQEW